MQLNIRLPASSLDVLRAKALAAAGAAAPPPLPPATAVLQRGGWRFSRCKSGRAAPAAAAAVATQAPRAAKHDGVGPTASRGSSSGNRHISIAAAEESLCRAVQLALADGRTTVALHVLQEEWKLTSRCLADPQLSEELILALVREVNTAAALDALPMVAASASLCRHAITALAQRNSLRGVRAMLQRAKDVRVAGGPEARGLWRAAIVAFGRLRRPAEARQAFVEMRALGAWEVSDTATVNLLLNALASDIRLQFIRFNQLRQEGVAPDASSFNCLLKGCMRARDARRAGLALGWMAEAEVPPDEITWNTLIKVFSYCGDFDGVLDVWARMGAAGHAPTPKLWGSLLLACSAAGQLEQAAIFWWEMRQVHAQGAGGVLTTDNVCGMMTACNDAGQYERALIAFEDARGLGVPLDTRAYNIALRACHTPGKTLRQEQLMQAFAIYDDLKRSHLAPDSFTFGTLFALCAAARQGHVALQLYAEMRELGVQENVVCMTALLKAVGATPGPGMAHEAMRLFRRMLRGPARVRPNQATYRTLIAALREQGEVTEAMRTYESMRRLYPADNSEFEGLTAVAAERALAREDAELRRMVAGVCKISSCAEVDLHGMSVLEARAAVLCVLAMLQQQFRDAGAVAHDVTIITGRGSGSEGGEAVLRREVAALLERLHLALPPDAVAAHPGRIVIPRAVVCEALRLKMTMAQRRRELQQGAGGEEAAGGGGAAGDRGHGGSEER